MAVLRTDIELKNKADSVWFYADAALIAFSHCLQGGAFKAHIEEIRYEDRRGKPVILSGDTPHGEDAVRFEYLAGEIEGSDWFAAQAQQAAALNFAAQRA